MARKNAKAKFDPDARGLTTDELAIVIDLAGIALADGDTYDYDEQAKNRKLSDADMKFLQAKLYGIRTAGLKDGLAIPKPRMGHDHVMILNDGETFTSLKGCKIVEVPDKMDTQDVEEALKDKALKVVHQF